MKVPVFKVKRSASIEDIDLGQVEIIASLGLKDDEIATIIGISTRTLNYWKKAPSFLQALKRGKLKADFQITKSLYEKAKAGDTTAMIFWLKNRRPDLWREKQEHEISGTFRIVHADSE